LIRRREIEKEETVELNRKQEQRGKSQNKLVSPRHHANARVYKNADLTLSLNSSTR
jgi:hypothetical protein